MKIQSIRGTHDILPGSVELWQKIEQDARDLFALYGYAEIRTPVLEETELFARSIGVETDIVRKEMYTIEDSKGKSITLRPEGTAPVVRSYLENGLPTEVPVAKLYYIGPMFRHERPQKGRYRQFHQIGAEVLGSDNPAIEAEVIEMLFRLLKQLGLEDFTLLINSVGCSNCRPAYVEKLREELRAQSDQLCEECRRRTETNPLRVLDCKVLSCQPVVERLPAIADWLCEECREHFALFRKYLDIQGIPAEMAPRLVRGLDYYVRTTFEIISSRLGPTQNALVGGGRYDGLSELIGGPPTKGFGFALGMERLVLLLSGRSDLGAPYQPPAPEIFLVHLDSAAFEHNLKLASELRRDGIFAYIDFEGKSVKSQMRQANRVKAKFTSVVGETELQTGRFVVKRMADGTQVTLGRNEIGGYLRKEK
ncbi:MAG: histidine--tRNA ligase [Acidobacteriota bacterium]